MANIEHKDITDPNVHEPKGVAAAAANKVYVSDGASSGSWSKVTKDVLDTSTVFGTNEVFLTAVIADVSTSSSVLVPIPFACTINSALLMLGGTITGANSTVSFARNDGASLGTSVTVTYSGSSEGTNFTFTATTNTTVSANGWVKIATDGGSTGTIPLYIVLKATRTA